MREYQSILESKLPIQGRTNNDYIYACPVCEDVNTGHHLYVNYDKGYFNCVKCDFGGRSLKKLFKFLHIDLDFDYEKIYSNLQNELDSIIKGPEKTSDEVVDYSKNLRTLTEFYNIHTKPLSPTARHYLYSRSITDSMIDRLRITEGVNRKGESFIINNNSYEGKDYSNRIMVPSLYKKDLITFYVGRDYTGLKPNKYVNPPNSVAYASEDVWNLYNIDSKSVIICEGVFSAIAAAKLKLNSCATYGKSISQRSNSDIKLYVTSQGEKLLNKNFDNYYVFYDKDAKAESIRTARYLYDRGANVKIVTITTDKYGPKADAADLTEEELNECLMNAQDYSPLTEILL